VVWGVQVQQERSVWWSEWSGEEGGDDWGAITSTNLNQDLGAVRPVGVGCERAAREECVEVRVQRRGE
jgi:hypothetical protein